MRVICTYGIGVFIFSHFMASSWIRITISLSRIFFLQVTHRFLEPISVSLEKSNSVHIVHLPYLFCIISCEIQASLTRKLSSEDHLEFSSSIEKKVCTYATHGFYAIYLKFSIQYAI